MDATRTTYDDLSTAAQNAMQTIGPARCHVQSGLVRVVDSLDVVSVLDVRCGTGDNLASLAGSAKRYELTGADVSTEALRTAALRVPAANLKLVDIQDRSLGERYDLVMAVHLIEHVLDDAAALRNMAGTATMYVLLATVGGRVQAGDLPVGHRRTYSSVELRAKLEAAGLDVVWIRGWGRRQIHWLRDAGRADVVTALARV